MIHDFATVPRHSQSPVYDEPTEQLVHMPNAIRWFLLLLVVCICVWILVIDTNKALPESVPGLDASLEYQQEMDIEYAVVEEQGTARSAVLVDHLTMGEEIDPEPVAQRRDPPSKTQVERPKKTQPESEAVPEYGFYDQLKSSQWSAPTQRGVYVDGNLATREKVRYKLQAASFRQRVDADRLANKLAKYRLVAQVKSSISTNGLEWYQVSVGPFSNISKLNKAQDVLVSLNMMPLKKKI